jgi:hypothetical protein
MTTLNDLSDVTITSPQEGQRLVYESGEWVNKTIDTTEWVRPSDWLSMPTVVSTDSIFVGLHAVHPSGGNFLALSATAAYTVDWGDGTTSNHATGTLAYKKYDYASISSTTESARGYRQVIVTVTPQAGQQLTGLNLKQKHNQSGLVNGYSSGWLDIVLSMPYCSISGLVISSNASTMYHRLMERVRVLNFGGLTSLLNGLHSCSALQSVSFSSTALVTNFGGLFNSCIALETTPLFDTSSGTTVGLFGNCTSLRFVPLYDMSAATSVANCFISSFALQSLPAFDLSSAIGVGGFVSGCPNLASVPILGMSVSFSVASCKLSASALDEIYANLPTVVGQTITVTGNYGTTGHTPSIATAKGWTVTA